jgi:putative flippase GtrA
MADFFDGEDEPRSSPFDKQFSLWLEAGPDALLSLLYLIAWIDPRIFGIDIVWSLGATVFIEFEVMTAFMCSLWYGVSNPFSVPFAYMAFAVCAVLVGVQSPSLPAGISSMLALAYLAQSRFSFYATRRSTREALTRRYYLNIVLGSAIGFLALFAILFPFPDLGFTRDFMHTMGKPKLTDWTGYGNPSSWFAFGISYFWLSFLCKYCWRPGWAYAEPLSWLPRPEEY